MNSLAWAVFLACSWTWCIGMYLPTLLVRDGGLPFFWAFFVPNVLGAASVGWLLAGKGRSERFVASKRPIMLAFTAVTISFHAFWLAWRAGHWLAGGEPDLLAGILAGGALVLGAVALRRRVDWAPAVVTLGVTLLLGVALLSSPPAERLARVSTDLIGLAAVTGLGFLLCPYLDLTFNRAAQNARSPRAAFTLGFLVVFAAILLVATRGRLIWTPAAPVFSLPDGALLAAIGAHFGAQATFTVSAHVAAMRRTSRAGSVGGRTDRSPGLAVFAVGPAATGLVLALAALLVSLRLDPARLPALPLPASEIVYRTYLGCYGLVFPVWLILTLGPRPALSRRTIAGLAITCLAAAPFYWIGMVERREVWLLPGVGIVLLSRLFAGPREPDRAGGPTASRA